MILVLAVAAHCAGVAVVIINYIHLAVPNVNVRVKKVKGMFDPSLINSFSVFRFLPVIFNSLF